MFGFGRDYFKVAVFFQFFVWYVSPALGGNAEGLLRIFAGFKGQQGLDYNSKVRSWTEFLEGPFEVPVKGGLPSR
ncbi:MAG: hypothetical protein KC931_15740 [Candidatus Omnitrophica bacterium]|nr:hypothetical protein [Candidatus Omnitrophota bacterium]